VISFFLFAQFAWRANRGHSTVFTSPDQQRSVTGFNDEPMKYHT
jgi:hypothetical protein